MNHPNIVWEVTSESGSYSDYEQSVLAVYKTKEEADKHLKAIENLGDRFVKLRETLQADLHAKYPWFYASVEECVRTHTHHSWYPSVSVSTVPRSTKNVVPPDSHDSDSRKMYAILQNFLAENEAEAQAIGYYTSAEYSVRYSKVFESFETRKEEEAVLEDFLIEHSLSATRYP